MVEAKENDNMGVISEKLKHAVEKEPGIKATKLLIDVIEVLYKEGTLVAELIKGENNNLEVLDCLTQLVKQQELVEVEYVLSSMDYRIKSLYFPKGTEIIVSKP